MKPKYVPLNDTLHQYLCCCHTQAQDPVLAALRRETDQLGEDAMMQISPDQGTFMTLLVAAIGARSAIEIGTFTGYSSICIARGLPTGGRLLCLDVNAEWTAVARRYWELAGVAAKIELRLGPALQTLGALEPEREFDFAFIDAEKTEYEGYFESILPRLRPNGLILFDNMLWSGRLGSTQVEGAAGQAIDRLNRALAVDPRVETVLLSVADGLLLCRKRP